MKQLLSLLCLLLVSYVSAQEKSPVPTYWKDIRPVLRKNCAYCHAARHLKKQDVSGGLALDTYENIFTSSKKKVIEKGKSKKSLLVKLIVTENKNLRMPLDGDPLPQSSIELLRRWIDTGAKEGKKPDSTEPKTIVTKPGKRRRLNVSFVTKTTPPKGVLGTIPPAPLVLNLKVGPLAPVTAVEFNPDNTLLATGSYGHVTIWDLNTFQPVKILTNFLGAVNDLKFSPAGEILAVAGGQPSAKGEIRLFKTSDWKSLAAFREHGDVAFAIDFSPDGQKLASASFDHTFRVWDLESLKLEKTYANHSDFVYGISFRPDGKALATASKDRTVRITNIRDGKSLFTMGGMEEDVMAVAFSPDGNNVVSSGFESALYWWNAGTGERTKLQRGHRVAVQELCFSKDGKVLASASADRTVRLWDGKKGNVIRGITVGSPVYTLDLSSDNNWLATGSFDGQVRIWNTKSGAHLLSLLSFSVTEEQVEWLALTPLGYFSGSEFVSKEGLWTMRGRTVEGGPVALALQKSEVLSAALQGKRMPTPSFTGKK